MADLETRIQAALDAATSCDQQAQALRREAGRLLAQLQAQGEPGTWYLCTGLDRRTVDMLLELGAGGRPHTAADNAHSTKRNSQ